MQIQGIEVIFFILSLAFLSNILKFCYKQHVQLKTISNITYSRTSQTSHIYGENEY